MARKRHVTLWAVMALFWGSRAIAADASPPLFSAFKAFCADTGARADAVKAAVEARKGVAHDPPTKSTQTPFPMETSLWDVKVDGQALVVAAGRAHTAEKAMADCVVSGPGADAASLAALAQWASVPANPGSNDRFSYYVFEDRNGAHQAVSDGKAAEVAGRIWRLTIIRAPGIASVELMHLLAPGQ